MGEANQGKSPLQAAAGAAGPHTTDAFELLGNETRLAILLALWEVYDPSSRENAIPFSKLYDRVSVADSGNFTYHLDKLVGHFVEETADGYQLRNAGHKIVQGVIAGTGLTERTLSPTEIDRSCHRCGAPIEIRYEDGCLYQLCTDCEGNIGPDSTEDAPRGTVMVWDFDPAGLEHRTPGELFVAGTIEFLREVGLLARGVCPECSGAIEQSLQRCKDHDAPSGKVCQHCGTRDEARASYVCSVCKQGVSVPVEGAVHDHPAVIAFRHEHDIECTYDIETIEDCSRLWDYLGKLGHTLVSADPLVVRVTVPAEQTALELTLDADLTVTDTTRRNRTAGQTRAER